MKVAPLIFCHLRVAFSKFLSSYTEGCEYELPLCSARRPVSRMARHHVPKQRNPKPERNETMKLTKTDIKETRTKLVEKLLEIERCKKEKDAFEAILDEDFKKNRDAYENGVPTPKGMLFRKPSYRCSAKPVVEAA